MENKFTYLRHSCNDCRHLKYVWAGMFSLLDDKYYCGHPDNTKVLYAPDRDGETSKVRYVNIHRFWNRFGKCRRFEEKEDEDG